jgi:hypothetical protein
MRSIQNIAVSVLVLSLILCFGTGSDAWAAQPQTTGAHTTNLSLSGSSALGVGLLGQDEPEEETETVAESTTVTTTEEGNENEYDLYGPYFLRSADPEEPGEMELKFIYSYETSSGPSDKNVFELEFEWGIAENIELILELPIELGDGLSPATAI